jgi:hypothetical protein
MTTLLLPEHLPEALSRNIATLSGHHVKDGHRARGTRLLFARAVDEVPLMDLLAWNKLFVISYMTYVIFAVNVNGHRRAR